MSKNEIKRKAFIAISEGFALLAEAYRSVESEVVEEQEVSKNTDIVMSVNEVKSADPVDEVEDVSETDEYTEESLNSMSYNDLKKLAKELGLSATGNRTAVVQRILEASKGADLEEPTEEIPVTESESTLSEPVEEDVGESEEEEPSLYEQVESAVADYSDDDIKAILEDVGIKCRGKRQSLLSKLTEAVEEGLIEFNSDEEDAESNEEVSETTETTSGDITSDMTDARKEAYEKLCKDTAEAFESQEITREDMIEFINGFNNTKETFKKESDAEVLSKYLELAAFLIDDEGNDAPENEPYFINDTPYCCGHPLEYREDEGVFYCSVCHNKYEAEE